MKQSYRLNIIVVRVFITMSILIGSLVTNIPVAKPVHAGGQFLWWTGEGDTFTTFGANASIVIDSGALDFTTGCEAPGIDDTLYPASSIYIMPSGSVSPGSQLTDISKDGTPNTVVGTTGGAFVLQTIGFTKPTGFVGPGTYAVIYDECQDGAYDEGVDFLLDPAFEVSIPANVPALPSIQALKDDAVQRSQYWSKAHFYYKALFELEDWLDIMGENFSSPSEDLHKPMSYAMNLWKETTSNLWADPKEIALTQLLNAVSHWQGIAADPPDPNYKQLSPLTAHPLIDLQSGDEVVSSSAQVDTEAGEESALAEALLRSLERYQGAAEANNGTWALIHAHAIQRYATLLASQMEESTAALASATTAISSDSREVDQATVQLTEFLNRVSDSGFNGDELRYVSNLEISTAQLDEIKSVLTAIDLTVFTKTEMLGTLSALQDSFVTTSTNLTALADEMNSIIATLENDPSVSMIFPTANAGGPYNGVEGSSINLDGQASTSPSMITDYDWDLDGSGAFDDAYGQAPSHAFPQAFTGWLGVQVTNSYGFSDVAYSTVSVSDINRPPIIQTYEPAYLSPIVIVGTSLAFQLISSDIDNDPVSIDWQVDGISIGNGGDFIYSPTPDQVGLHLIQAIASDSNPIGGSIIQSWIVTVLLNDADGDLWNANVDCDDNNPQINPGMIEIIGNGLDDDCNAATPDSGDAPRALFNPVPQSGSFNAARFEHGATIVSVSNPVDSSTYKYKLLDDDELSNKSLVANAPGDWVKVQLAGSQAYLIDRVQISGSNNPEAVRHFEIAVSTTTTDEDAFTTVLTAEAQKVVGMQEFILPSPALARYIRYRTVDNWQGSYFVRTQRLEVMSGQKSTSTTVTFQDFSSDVNNDIVFRTWDFGDGTTSTEPNPTHTFPGPGIYPVSLTVTDASNQTSTFSLDQQIVDTSDPDGPTMGSQDTRGTDFWLAFMRNTSGTVETGYLHLYISSDVATSGKVTFPRLLYSTDFQVTPGQITTVVIPNYMKAQGEYTRSSGLEDLGIHVTADEEVTVYGINRVSVTSDAFTALPTDALGTDYLVMAYVSGTTAYYGDSTEYAVVATQDNTQVTITSSALAQASPPNPGDTYTLTMQRGQVYQFVGEYTWALGNDVTGTWVHSDKPVAIFGGHSCAFVPSTSLYCDHLAEQIPPISTWGKEFITMPLAGRTKGDTFRILASEDGTTIQINDDPAFTLNRSQHAEMILTQASHIIADKPVLVAQYSNSATWDYAQFSDPFMMLVPPYEQFMNGYTVMTPSSGFRVNYINIVVPQAGVGAIQLDGEAVPGNSYTPVGNSGFFGAAVPVALGTHNLSGVFPFGVFVYGFDGTDSYGYPGGSALAKVARAASLTIHPETAEQEVESQFCATATLLDINSQPLAGVRIDFIVSGVNNQSNSAVTFNDGTVQYCYTNSIAGQDSITARMGTLLATALVNWGEIIHNQPPLADAGADQQVNEGTVVSLDGSNSSDPDSDQLTYAWDLDNDGVFGDAVGVQASITFADNGIFPVSLQVSDPAGLSAVDTIMITVDNVAPVIEVQPAIQSLQYSDEIAQVTFTAIDVAADILVASTAWSNDGVNFTAGLPGNLELTSSECTEDGFTRSCSWSLSGVFNLPAETFLIRTIVEDDDGASASADSTLLISLENTQIALDSDNPMAVKVAAPGGKSPSFTLFVDVQEALPDAGDHPHLGDISNAVLSMTLLPVGSGSSATTACTPTSIDGDGYDTVRRFSCTFSEIAVNTYSAQAEVTGNYYHGSAEDVLVVYDPSLGFTTGGGWFSWPGTNDHTNFGFTMKYNKKGDNLQGSLLLIRHLPDGTIYRMKSSALYGLSLGQDLTIPMGWASFSGKGTYLEPGWPEPVGNYEFLVYLEDRNEPGTGVDSFWIEVVDKDRIIEPDLSIYRPASTFTEPIQGGNLVVPHQAR